MTFSTGRSLRLAALLKLALLVAVYVLIGDVSIAANRFSVADVPNVHLADAAQYVSDPDKQILPQDVTALNSRAAEMEREMGVQMAIVVLKDMGDNDAREFATDLFNAWGLGEKGKDNGLLVLLVTEPPQRSVTFETGYGLEGPLPDAIAYRLQQRYMVPYFRNGEWGQGLISGIDATRKYLAADVDGRVEMLAPEDTRQQERQEDISPFSIALMVGGFFLLLFIFRRNPAALAFLLSSIFSGRGGRGGGFGGGGSWGGGGSGGGGSMSRF